MNETTEFEMLLQDLRLAQIELALIEENYVSEKTWLLAEIKKTENALTRLY